MHFPMLCGVIAMAAATEAALAHPELPLATDLRIALGGGASLFICGTATANWRATGRARCGAPSWPWPPPSLWSPSVRSRASQWPYSSLYSWSSRPSESTGARCPYNLRTAATTHRARHPSAGGPSAWDDPFGNRKRAGRARWDPRFRTLSPRTLLERDERAGRKTRLFVQWTINRTKCDPKCTDAALRRSA